MPKKNPRPGGLIIKLQVANLICLLLVFAITFWSHHILGKLQARMAKTPGAAHFDKEFSARLGKPYTKDQHEFMATMFTAYEDQTEGLTEMNRNLSALIYQIGGASFLLTSATIFFAVRDRSRPALPYQVSFPPE
jgi:hypothetical protein